MRIQDVYCALFVVAGAGVGLTLALGMADAATGRGAAIERCTAQARASVPTNRPARETQRRETAIYRNCMAQAGFRP
jgi:hypothetical protein